LDLLDLKANLVALEDQVLLVYKVLGVRRGGEGPEELRVQWESQETQGKMVKTESLEFKGCQDVLGLLDNLETRDQLEIKVQKVLLVFLDLLE